MASGLVEGLNGSLRLPVLLLNEVTADEISRPVEAVSAVDSYQSSLGLSLRHSGVEPLYFGTVRDRSMALHLDFDVIPAMLVTVP